jgi:hypothetical protein
MKSGKSAFQAFVTPIRDGGCLFVDKCGDPWIEAYITDPAAHILNGFMGVVRRA